MSSHELRKSTQQESKIIGNEFSLEQILCEIEDAIFITDSCHKFILASPAFCKLLGVEIKELDGKYESDLFVEELGNSCQKYKGETNKLFITNKGNYCIFNHNGINYLLIKNCLNEENSGNKILIGLIKEIGDRQPVEEALFQENAQLVETKKMAHVGSWEINLAIGSLKWSEETSRIFGLSPGSLAPSLTEHLKQIYPDDRWLWQTSLNQVVNQGIPCELELRILRPDCSIRYIFLRGSPIFNATQVTGIAGIIQDITDRKKVEESLRQSKLLMERITNFVPQILYVYDLKEKRNIYANRQTGECLGYTPEEIQQQGTEWVLETIHPEDLPLFLEASSCCDRLSDGEVLEAEFRQKHRNGSWRWFHCRNVVFTRNAQGLPEHILGTAQDITDRKLTELALWESQAKLHTIVTSTSDGILIVDRQGLVRFANPAAVKLFSRPLEDLLNNEFGVPIVAGKTTEINIIPAGGEVCIGEMSVTETEWDGASVYVISLRDITKRRQTEDALRESEQRFRQLAENIADFFWLFCPQTEQMLYVSPAYEKIWGRSCQSLYEQPLSWIEALHPEDRITAQANLAKQLRGEETSAEYRILRPDGEIRWIFKRAFPIKDEWGEVYRITGIAQDISDRKRVEKALRKSEEQLRLIFELAPIGIGITAPDGQFLRVNQALCNFLGYTTDELLQLTLADITHPTYGEISLASQKQLLQEEISNCQIENCYLAKDGQLVHALLQIALVRDAQGRPMHYINQIVNISERKRVEEQLIHDALHDSLTGLPNRAFFNERVDQAIRRVKRHPDYLFAVLFIDLDRFKVVNDSLGHLIGDKLLMAIAHRLQKLVRNTDTVARLGGDEFTVLLEEVKDIKEVTRIAQRIGDSLKSPFKLDAHEVFTTASIGIALSSTGYQQVSELLRDADIAMYRAKELGKARYEVFDKTMHTQIFRLLQLENDLRRGLERREFELYYQPIVSLKTGTLTGFEALIRWQNPESGLISPAEFIPLAEETGLIVSIGEWVLREACRQMQTWKQKFANTETWKISVNISTKQLKEINLIEQIDQILQETGLDGSSLKLEITESVLMENSEAATTILLQLRSRKIELSIDDFGTGYSSLSYLHRFPVNTLKVDRSFVSRMNPNGENSEIVRAIITLAHTLRMDVIAEGVEILSQLIQLKDLGCEQGQGYYFSQPLDPKAAETFINRAIGTS